MSAQLVGGLDKHLLFLLTLMFHFFKTYFLLIELSLTCGRVHQVRLSACVLSPIQSRAAPSTCCKYRDKWEAPRKKNVEGHQSYPPLLNGTNCDRPWSSGHENLTYATKAQWHQEIIWQQWMSDKKSNFE